MAAPNQSQSNLKKRPRDQSEEIKREGETDPNKSENHFKRPKLVHEKPSEINHASIKGQKTDIKAGDGSIFNFESNPTNKKM
jgi:hypothetical protein